MMKFVVSKELSTIQELEDIMNRFESLCPKTHKHISTGFGARYNNLWFESAKKTVGEGQTVVFRIPNVDDTEATVFKLTWG